MGNAFTTTAAVAGSGMTLTTARSIVRQFARNAGSSSQYSDAEVDRAIYSVCERFAEETRYIHVTSSVSLTADSAVADFSAISGFDPDRLLSAYVVDVAEPLDIIDYDTLNRQKVICAETGDPRMLAWDSLILANVYPTPTENQTLKARWFSPFTSWTFGTAGDASITFNLPDTVLTQILPVGPPALLQHTDIEHAYGIESNAEYMKVENRYRGRGGLGAKVLVRSSLRDIERRRRW